MLFAGFCAMLLIENPEQRDYGSSLFVTALGVSFYVLVLLVTGHSRRMLQTMTAILGCGAILTLLVFLETVLLRPLLGNTVAGLLALLIIFWSVPVEGHIIARAIDRHWYIGIALAVAAFALQLAFQVHATRS